MVWGEVASAGQVLSCTRSFCNIFTVGMHVKCEVISSETIVSSESSVISLTLLAESFEFFMWCSPLPTKGARILAQCLDML